jgi:hypothetical protein
MSRLPEITERSGRFIIALLLCLKLMLLVWNAIVYDGVTYQPERQSDRALFGGLKIGKLSYDPPLYYLPARLLPRPADVPLVERSSDEPTVRPGIVRKKQPSKQERAFRGELLDVLRYTNVLWVGFFYVAWIYYAFPRLLRDRRAWFLASLALLAIPGYQKLAAMSHPDNLFAAASALSVCVWLWLRQRWQETSFSSDANLPLATGHAVRDLTVFALAIGLVGLTRPLALAYIAPLTLVALVYAARFSATSWQQLLGRAMLIVTLVGVMSASWYIVRWRQTGVVLASVPADVSADYEPLRRGFPYAHYFLSFYPAKLWDNPNVGFGEAPTGTDARSAPVNSFLTLLHSEVWGDHWLSFSGPKQKDTKAWAKRISFSTALLTPFITLLLFAAWLWSFGKRGTKIWQAGGSTLVVERLRSLGTTLETELVLGAISVLGAALFVWWQTGPALLPGDHSSLKFVHVAAFFPPAIALLLSRTLEKLPALLLAGYVFVVFVAAFPVAMYYPG